MLGNCTYMSEPALDEPCHEEARFLVVVAAGTGQYESGLPRCETHLAKTIDYLAAFDHSRYPYNYLRRIASMHD